MPIRSSLIALSGALLIAPTLSAPAIAQAEAEASADEQLTGAL